MGVYIKGMQMPDNCYQCMISGFRTAIKCNEWTKISSELRQTNRTLSCPIVELPEHHGRLIDADELKTAFPRCDNNMDIKIASVRATINHMPTIVEAEGAEE